MKAERSIKQKMKSILAVMAVVLPVSYTHLDVYKRQPDVKTQGSTLGLHLELPGWSAGEVSGIPSVAVKCVDIRRNTCLLYTSRCV